MLTKSAERQTFAGLLLVDRMDIIRVARIYRDRKTGMPQGLRRESLGFAHLGPGVIHRNLAMMLVIGQADYVKRKVSLAEQPAPIGDHCRKQSTVLRGVLLVRLPLVPDCARNGKRHNRRQHAVVQDAGHDGAVLESERQGLWRPAIYAQLSFPRTVQRNHRAIA